jgi:hypothetical protein
MELRCSICCSKMIMVAGRPICTQCDMTEDEELVEETEMFLKDLHGHPDK